MAESDRRWLTRMWARADVRAALRLASPSLADQLDDVTSEGTCEQASAERLRRFSLAVTFCLLRRQRRPTPFFGGFAGIAPVRTGMAAGSSFGSGHRVVTRADGQWLAALVDRLEPHPELLPRLRVVINNTYFVRGGRVVLADRPSTGQVGSLAGARPAAPDPCNTLSPPHARRSSSATSPTNSPRHSPPPSAPC
jgi:lantibiotic biosynthesis protein